MPLIPICRRCHKSPPTVQFWAASDLCAGCAAASLMAGQAGVIGIPQVLLLNFINALCAAGALLDGEVPPTAGQEIRPLLAAAVGDYQRYAMISGVPRIEALAELQERKTDVSELPRLWRPGD